MKTSESIKNLTKALLQAQTQMGAAKKDSKNPFFKSSYADLPTVMEVVKAPLNEAGIIVLQPASNRDGKNFITTTLIHGETGEWMTSETEVVSAKQNDPQAFGAAQTYARRFGLQAMLFIPAEDDDGNAAAGRTTTQARPTPTATPVAKAANPLTAGLPANTALLGNNTNVNVEFDAIPAPAKTEAAPATTILEPLKKSSFRNKAAPKPVVTATTTDENGWN
jgi:hypothetical protein